MLLLFLLFPVSGWQWRKQLLSQFCFLLFQNQSVKSQYIKFNCISYSIIRLLIKSRYHTRKNKILFKTNRHTCFKSSPSCDRHRIITMESTMKLQVMISTVSNMLLKGSHGATSRASCREQDRDGETASALQVPAASCQLLVLCCCCCVFEVNSGGFCGGFSGFLNFASAATKKPLGAKLLRVAEVVSDFMCAIFTLAAHKPCTVEPSALALSV